MEKLKFIKDRIKDYDSNMFINELFISSKSLGILEEKINSYKFDSILIPLLNQKEAISSMYIEGTQTTMSDVIEDAVTEEKERKNDKVFIEACNHTRALRYGTDYLKQNNFTHNFIKEIHKIMLTNIVAENKVNTLGKYQEKDNFIVNSVGTIVYINPLIKTAIIHSQFESIHPFDDGNGRVGRLLITLCLYKFKAIQTPFFYISEAISQNKLVYYNKLTDARNNDYTSWIKFFLSMCTAQTEKHIRYIEALNKIYDTVSAKVKKIINTQKYEEIISCIFTQPIITSSYLAEKINISTSQSRKYLAALENAGILSGDDRIRNRKYHFLELLELVNKKW